jgi:uncharacterized protein (DUF4415 family)
MKAKRSSPASRRSASDLRLAKAARIPDAQVIAAALSDPDTFLLTAEDLARAVLVIPPPKKSIALRVDQDVLDFYRSGGRGYQTRMNAALRAVMDAKRRQRPAKGR